MIDVMMEGIFSGREAGGEVFILLSFIGLSFINNGAAGSASMLNFSTLLVL